MLRSTRKFNASPLRSTWFMNLPSNCSLQVERGSRLSKATSESTKCGTRRQESFHIPSRSRFFHTLQPLRFSSSPANPDKDENNGDEPEEEAQTADHRASRVASRESDNRTRTKSAGANQERSYMALELELEPSRRLAELQVRTDLSGPWNRLMA